MIRAAFLAGAMFMIVSCSTPGKTRIDCFHDCKVQGLKWSGVVSRTERYDDEGRKESRETCRCSIEEPL